MFSMTVEEDLSVTLSFSEDATSTPCGCRDFLDLMFRSTFYGDDTNDVPDEKIKP